MNSSIFSAPSLVELVTVNLVLKLTSLLLRHWQAALNVMLFRPFSIELEYLQPAGVFIVQWNPFRFLRLHFFTLQKGRPLHCNTAVFFLMTHIFGQVGMRTDGMDEVSDVAETAVAQRSVSEKMVMAVESIFVQNDYLNNSFVSRLSRKSSLSLSPSAVGPKERCSE